MEVYIMKESTILNVTNEPVSTVSVQDEALNILTVMLYRMYKESVDQDGDTGRAA